MSGIPQAITLGATVGFGIVLFKKIDNGKAELDLYWNQLTGYWQKWFGTPIPTAAAPVK
jgi:hypothetical protein